MQVAQQIGLGGSRRLPRGARDGRGPRATSEELTAYAIDGLPGGRRHGLSDRRTVEDRGGEVSFWYRDVHPHDLAQVLNEEGVACAPVTTAPSS